MKRVSRYLALLLAIAMLLSLSGFAEMPAEPQDGFGETGEAGDIMEIGGAVDPESSESGDVDLSDLDGAPTEPGVGGETLLDENGNPISVDGPATDGGETPVEGGQPAADGGETPVEGDQPAVDGGETPVEGDQPATDGGETPDGGE